MQLIVPMYSVTQTFEHSVNMIMFRYFFVQIFIIKTKRHSFLSDISVVQEEIKNVVSLVNLAEDGQLDKEGGLLFWDIAARVNRNLDTVVRCCGAYLAIEEFRRSRQKWEHLLLLKGMFIALVGAISCGFTSLLVSIMSAQRYVQEILKPHLILYLKTFPTLQQSHIARIILGYFEHTEINLGIYIQLNTCRILSVGDFYICKSLLKFWRHFDMKKTQLVMPYVRVYESPDSNNVKTHINKV